MKTLLISILILFLSGPAFAWDDHTDEWNEDVRQAEEENYRNRMLAIQEDLLWLKRQEHDLRIREYWERK
jgi:hypothetical protein